MKNLLKTLLFSQTEKSCKKKQYNWKEHSFSVGYQDVS